MMKHSGVAARRLFSGYAWDAIMLAEAAIPGRLELRSTRNRSIQVCAPKCIEASKAVPTTAGPVTMSADDHNGYSDDAPVMITVKNGLFSINR